VRIIVDHHRKNSTKDPKARFIPSTIAFPLSAENVELKHALVGHAIKEAGLSEQQLPSENTFENLPVFAYVKKSAELQQIYESERWAVQFETAKDDELRVRVSSTSSVVLKSPQDISRFFLEHFKKIIDKECLAPILRLVISLSPSTTSEHAKMIKDVMSAAGYRFILCYPTPLAVTLAYQYYPLREEHFEKKSNHQHKKAHETHNYLSINWSASATDISLVTSEGKKFGSKTEMKGFETLKQSSGQDITEMLVQHCVTEFAMKSKLSRDSIMLNKKSLARLRRECEEVKCSVSEENHVSIVHIGDFFDGKALNVSISFILVQNMYSPIVVKILDAINILLTKHKMCHQDIDEIFFSGGSTRFARLRREISMLFLNKPIRDELGLNNLFSSS